MKYKLILLSITVTLQLQATSITSLLNTLEQRPENRLDTLNVEKSFLGKQAVGDKLMPTVNLYGAYEMYSSPNGMLPVAPNNLTDMVKDQNIGQPFSKKILKEGINFNWPIFVKSLYTLKDKASLLHLAAKEKRKLNFIQREAVIVGSVAQLRYLEALKSALHSKKHSILQTQHTTKIQVKEGRAPKSALFILNSHINTLDIAMNNIEQNINILNAKIETLTGIHIHKSVTLHEKNPIKKGEIFALKPLQKKLLSIKKEYKQQEKPTIPV